MKTKGHISVLGDNRFWLIAALMVIFLTQVLSSFV